MPMIGRKKLYNLLSPDFKRMKIELGRDKFFSILRRKGFIIHRKRRYVNTTIHLIDFGFMII